MKIRRSFLFAVVFCLFGASCGTSIPQEAGKAVGMDLPEGYDYEKLKAGFPYFCCWIPWMPERT